MTMNEGRPASLETTTTFHSRLQNKTAQIGVIGLGYVGLPLGLLFARNGFPTTGFDIDQAKVDVLEKGGSYIRHIPGSAVTEQVEKKAFRATANFALLETMDAILICVPTPLDRHREPDLSFVRNTAQDIAPHLRRGQLVVLESTTYPGTTEEVVLPILEQSGLKCPILPYVADGWRVISPRNPGATFSWHFPRSGKIPETRSSKPTKSPRLSAV